MDYRGRDGPRVLSIAGGSGGGGGGGGGGSGGGHMPHGRGCQTRGTSPGKDSAAATVECSSVHVELAMPSHMHQQCLLCQGAA